MAACTESPHAFAAAAAYGIAPSSSAAAAPQRAEASSAAADGKSGRPGLKTSESLGLDIYAHIYARGLDARGCQPTLLCRGEMPAHDVFVCVER